MIRAAQKMMARALFVLVPAMGIAFPLLVMFGPGLAGVAFIWLAGIGVMATRARPERGEA